METALPLSLTGGAFAVYQQMMEDDKRDSSKIKLALRTAFAVDSFTAYELFVSRRLHPGETVDVFLAELRRLAVPFGGLSDNALVYAFVAGLPESVRQLLRAGSRMNELPLIQILARARAMMTDEVGVAAAVGAGRIGAGAPVKQTTAATAAVTAGLLCYECNLPNHLARDCLLRRRDRGDGYGGGGRGRRGGRGGMRCYRCDGLNHFASSCPGKANGSEKPTLAVCGGAVEPLSDERIAEIHESTGHHGIKRTLYVSRKLSPAVTRKEVQRVVKACQVCQSVDPAPVKWTWGELNVDKIW